MPHIDYQPDCNSIPNAIFMKNTDKMQKDEPLEFLSLPALNAAAVASAQKLPNSEYTQADISDELYREIIFPGELSTIRINEPLLLITRKGGSTHRVVDSKGEVYCYAAPETGKTVIRWKAREGKAAVKF